MANFFHVLKGIASAALSAEPLAAGIVSVVVPGGAAIGALMNGITGHLQGAIVNAEAATQDGKAGALKYQAVQAAIDNGLWLANDVLGTAGNRIVYDQSLYQTAVNAQVAAYNAAAAWKQSFKVVAIPKP